MDQVWNKYVIREDVVGLNWQGFELLKSGPAKFAGWDWNQPTRGPNRRYSKE